MERISVIVPIYKVEKYLDYCIRSIVDQTYRNLEIILVDDGSPDNCPALCDTWAEKDCRIRVIHKENGGLSDARNAGMSAASGDLVSFIDSDDTISPDFLEQLYRALTAQDADVAECAVSYVNEAGDIQRQRSAAELPLMDRLEALRRLVLEDGVYQTVWNKLYRRSAIQDIQFAVGKYNEDEFWTYRVFERIEKLAIVSKPMYNYLQRSTSIIGVGYNIRRLDGLEARFQRMRDLQKYDQLAVLTRQNLVLDCMWHYQYTKKYLNGREQAEALEKIRETMGKCPPVPLRQLGGRWTHRIWYVLFRLTPELTTLVREKAGVGA